MTKTDKALEVLTKAKAKRPSKLGKGLAIAGIWLGVGLAFLSGSASAGDLIRPAMAVSIVVTIIF